ncbi:MAG: NAD(P) transhydrogenase subunit alpha [Trueperaceae bacterium]|nr:NAD(P) transhydrogenase subunit alpha [Trueperaceae bacterium]
MEYYGMNFASVLDPTPGERRVALTPDVVGRLTKWGAEVHLEPGYGAAADHADDAYAAAGATFAPRDAVLARSDALLALNPPDVETLRAIPEGSVVASFLDPFRRPEGVAVARERKLATLCLELIPRTSYAQKMDALSSQASLGGYAAVILAAERSPKSFPMMSTPAGTIAPARVFVVGVGVAGLQAIATAKRLGARVEAYDTRPVVAEQVQSLGAKFVELDVGETGQTEQGYAKELTPEQLAEQRRQMAAVVAGADVVITTAQLFGRPAPRIVDADMVAGMAPGSVIVDMAASTGGNVEGSVADEEVVVNGVRILGDANLPARVPRDASAMYASNLFALVAHAWDADAGALALDPEGDEVLDGALLTYDGVVRDARVAKALEGGAA